MSEPILKLGIPAGSLQQATAELFKAGRQTKPADPPAETKATTKKTGQSNMLAKKES